MKSKHLNVPGALILSCCLFCFSAFAKTIPGNDKDLKNTPTHTVSVTDITKESEMPREMRSGNPANKPINSLSITAFNISAVNGGNYQLSFNLPVNGTTFVRIVDENGFDKFFETFKDGTNYNKQLDLSTLPAGTYFFQVTQKGKTFTTKLTFV